MTLGNYILKLTAWMLVPYILGWLLFWIYPQHYFGAYPFIIIVFLLMSIPFYSILTKSSVMPQRQFFARFLGNMFFKIALSMIIILLYILLIKVNIVPFLLVYLVFYFDLLSFEIVLFTKTSKKLKESNEV